MKGARHFAIIGDSRNMKEVKSSSVQICVTSPPYFMKKKYETQYDSYEDYRDYLKEIWMEVYRVLSDGGLFFVNIGNSFDNQFKAFDISHDIVTLGFNFVQTVIWVKGHHSPVQGKRHLNHLYEYVFIFSKTTNYELERLAIGIPYKDKSNIGRWKIAREDLRCRGDVWYVNYETVQTHSQKLHEAIFPKELPELCIKVASKNQNDLVLDPFLGSGTTILAAESVGRPSIGYEVNQEYEKTIRKKLSQVRGLKIINASH